jgi:hypothetical protein
MEQRMSEGTVVAKTVKVYAAMFREREFTLRTLAEKAYVDLCEARSIVEASPKQWWADGAHPGADEDVNLRVEESAFSELRQYIEQHVVVPDEPGEVAAFLGAAQVWLDRAGEQLRLGSTSLALNLVEQAELIASSVLRCEPDSEEEKAEHMRLTADINVMKARINASS